MLQIGSGEFPNLNVSYDLFLWPLIISHLVFPWIFARDSIYAKRAYAIAIPSVRLSVCLSVTRVIHAKNG